MKKGVVLLLSMLFGFIVSVIIAASILFGTKFFAGGVMNFEKDKGMYITLILPITIGLGVLGAYFYDRPNRSNKQMWKITLISVLAISLISGTIGTIVSDVILYGSERVNFEGRIVWGVLYSLFALPITLVIGKVLIEILAEFVAIAKKKPLL